MNGKNYAKEAGTWTGVGILVAEAFGFHPVGMIVGAGVTAGSRWLARDKKASWR